MKKRLTALILAMLLCVSDAYAAESEIDFKDPENVIKLYDKLLDYTEDYYRFDITREELLRGSVEKILQEHPELFDEVAKGAYGKLDEHSYYLTSAEYEERLEGVTKQFQGVGVSVILQNGKTIVTQVHDNTPAATSGLKEGDVITAVNGTDISGKALEDVVALIRGAAGTKVTLIVQRGSKEIKFLLTRDVISIKTVTYENLNNNNSGYIRIDSFSTNTLHDFETAAADLISQGVDKVILDLRYNGGGFLTAAVGIASWFVPEGKLIVTESYKDESADKNYYSGENKERFSGVVVLANEYSASASEIVTGAVKEHKIGPVVGKTTFGKGTIQSSDSIINGGAVWLTVGQYNLPKGDNIHGVGISPDYEIENTEKEIDFSKLNVLAGDTVMSLGDKSDGVLALKQYLSVIGYQIFEMNDEYDEHLADIVTDFQSSKELFPYGVADLTTQKAIISSAHECREIIDNQLEKAKELIFKM